MAVIDLGQFDTTEISAASFGPPVRRVRVHVVQVTESEREERCHCAARIPVGGELYLVNGRASCAPCFESRRPALKPARGFYPEERFGPPEPPRRRVPWRHRR